jgi:hypothetical protein
MVARQLKLLEGQKSLGSGALSVARLMRAAVGGKKFLLKVSRELSGVVNHLGGKPSSRPMRSAILRHYYDTIGIYHYYDTDTIGIYHYYDIATARRRRRGGSALITTVPRSASIQSLL